jgi:formylglycine-generating enzyme
MLRRASVLLFLATAGCEIIGGIGDVTLAEPGDAGADGAADATLGDAGSDGAPGADGDAGVRDGDSDAPLVTSCAGRDGSAPMVRIDVPGGSSFCIDRHEVTNAELKAFLDTGDSYPPFPPGLAAPWCSPDASTLQRPTPPVTAAMQPRPAESIQWCFAYAYCKWANKRLCGRIGGGQSVDRNTTDTHNQWDYACVNGGPPSTLFPYGDTYAASTCNTETTSSVDVESSAACHGEAAPFAAVFDMSGNVSELDDVASEIPVSDAGAPTVCARGGDSTTADASSCGDCNHFGLEAPMPKVGFRCCLDLSK